MSIYKITLLGECYVGKSCLVIQYLQNQFLEEYDPTIEDSYRKQATIDKESCFLEILDTAGEDEFSAMREKYIRDSNGFLLIFSITNKKTFEEISRYKELVTRIHEKDNVPMVIVGNKSDLSNERAVLESEALELAKKYNCSYFETSAKINYNIEEVFEKLVREMRKNVELKN